MARKFYDREGILRRLFNPFEPDEKLTVWDDEKIDGLAVTLRGGSDPDLVSVGASGGCYLYGFDGSATSEEAYFSVQFSHQYKEGSVIRPHVHWMPSDTGSGNVVWQLEFMWANVNDTFPAPTTVKSDAQAAGGVAWVHKIASFRTVESSGKKISSVLIGRIFRDPADSADTYGSDAILLSIDIHIEKDSLGSREVTKK